MIRNTASRNITTSPHAVTVALVAVLLATLSACARSAAPPAAMAPASAPAVPRAAIEQLIKDFEGAWNQHNMDNFGELLAEDVTFVEVHAQRIRTRDEVVRSHRHIHATFYRESELRMTLVDVRMIAEDAAVVSIDWQLSRAYHPVSGEPMPTSTGMILMVVRPTEGKWRIDYFQNTRAEQAPPAVH